MVTFLPPHTLPRAPYRAQVVRCHQKREQRCTGDLRLELAAELLRWIDTLVCARTRIQVETQVCQPGKREFFPQILRERLRPTFQLCITLAWKDCVRVTEKDVDWELLQLFRQAFCEISHDSL